MNDVYERVYNFYNIIPPVNENQGFYLNLSQTYSKCTISESMESRVLKTLVRLRKCRNKGLSSQDSKEVL